MSQSVLIIGGTADIGRAIARAYAAQGDSLILTGRDPERLARDAADLHTRHGGAVATLALDVADADSRAAFLAALPELPDCVICVVGLLERDGSPDSAARMMAVNYTAPVLLLEALAGRMAARGSGVIIGISSVAGERGRAAGIIYGSSKAGFTAYLSGLRQARWREGVRVITIKPGFVRTRMTAAMKLPPVVTATSEEVAGAVLAAHQGRRDVVYVRRIWWAIMAIIRALPEPLFKRMRF